MHWWGLIKERHDRVLFLLVKVVTRTLGITQPHYLKQDGGIAKPDVIETAKFDVDLIKYTDRDTTSRRPDMIVTMKEVSVATIVPCGRN